MTSVQIPVPTIETTSSDNDDFPVYPMKTIKRSSIMESLISLKDSDSQAKLEKDSVAHLNQINWSSNYTNGFNHIMNSIANNRVELTKLEAFILNFQKTYIDSFDSLKKNELNLSIERNGSALNSVLFSMHDYLTSSSASEGIKNQIDEVVLRPLRAFMSSYDKFLNRNQTQYSKDLASYSKTLNSLIALSNELNEMLARLNDLKSTNVEITRSSVDSFFDNFQVKFEFELLFNDFEEFQSHLSYLQDSVPLETISSFMKKHENVFKIKKLIRILRENLEIDYIQIENLINYYIELKLLKFPGKGLFKNYIFRIEDENSIAEWSPLFNQVINYTHQELTVDHDRINTLIAEYKPKYEIFLKLYFEFAKQREQVEKSLNQIFNNIERKEFERIQLNYKVIKNFIDIVKQVRPVSETELFMVNFERIDKMDEFYYTLARISSNGYYIPNALNNQLLNRLMINQLNCFPNFQNLVLLFNNDLSLQIKLDPSLTSGQLQKKSLPYFIDKIITEIESTYSIEEQRKFWLSPYNLTEVYQIKENYLYKLTNLLDPIKLNWKLKSEVEGRVYQEEEYSRNKQLIDDIIEDSKKTSNLILLLKIFLLEMNLSLIPPISMALENYHDFGDVHQVSDYLNEILNSMDRCSLSTLLCLLNHLERLKQPNFVETLIYKLDIPLIQFIHRPILFQKVNDDKFSRINKFKSFLFLSLIIRPESIKLIEGKLNKLENKFEKIANLNRENHQRQASLPRISQNPKRLSNPVNGVPNIITSSPMNSRSGSTVTSPKQPQLKTFGLKSRRNSLTGGGKTNGGMMDGHNRTASVEVDREGKLTIGGRKAGGLDIFSLSRNSSPTLKASEVPNVKVDNDFKLDNLNI